MIGPELRAQLGRIWPGAVVVQPELGAPSEVLVPGGGAPADAVLRDLGLSLAGQVWARSEAGAVEAFRVRVHAHADEIRAAAAPGPDGLLEPAPAHQLLLAAERLAADDAVESELLAAASRAVVAADPDVWRRALKRGLDWGLWRALAHLERAIAGATVTSVDRADARRELVAARGRTALWQSAPGVVVALSGVDGAGKSVQCRALQSALMAAGVPAAVEWTRVAADRRLDAIARPGVVLLQAARRMRGGSRTSAPASAVEASPAGEARSLRQRSRLVNVVWAYVVITLTVSAQRASTRLHRRQGRVVIRDRYLLDAVVQLRDDYGVKCGRLARTLLTRLAPRPSGAFLLVVAPEVARARKPEQFDVADLRRLTDGYLRAAAELGVAVVDGERPPAQITTELFNSVWRQLAQTRAASRSSRTG